MLSRRQPPPPPQQSNPPKSTSDFNVALVILGVLIAALLVLALVGYQFLRRLRKKTDNSKYIPTSYLKGKWQAWMPKSKYGQVAASERSHDLSHTETSYQPTTQDVEEGRRNETANGVDRHTSVRSIMTLPPYSQSARETEEVIGREGERAGMDTVVEFPETANDEEVRREEEMESLYQIRQARRREIAEREDRRRERRDARNRGDWVRLDELQRASRARAAAATLGNDQLNDSTTNLSAATMLAEHQSRGRERRVSSVAYASLGQVRHDGSRLRANSDDSERGGLLQGAAPMGEGQGRNRGTSDATMSTLRRPHMRERSASSAMSVSTNGSDAGNHIRDAATPLSSQGRPRTSDSDPQHSGTSNSSPTAQRFTPEDSTGSDDVPDPRLPTTSEQRLTMPPDYEHLDWGDAPDYETAIRRAESQRLSQNQQLSPGPRGLGLPIRLPSQAPRLPTLVPLPSINVEGATEPNTPRTLDPTDML